VDDYVVCFVYLWQHVVDWIHTFFPLFWKLDCHVFIVFRWDLMSWEGQMSLTQRIWRRDWLKLKWSFLRVNRLKIHRNPVHKPGVCDKVRAMTLQILIKS
jgi:hypothetical protein